MDNAKCLLPLLCGIAFFGESHYSQLQKRYLFKFIKFHTVDSTMFLLPSKRQLCVCMALSSTLFGAVISAQVAHAGSMYIYKDNVLDWGCSALLSRPGSLKKSMVYLPMITSDVPRMTAFPAKKYPEVIPTIGARPESLPQVSNVRNVRLLDCATSVSPGRPPPPSVKNTQGIRRRSAISNIRSFFL